MKLQKAFQLKSQMFSKKKLLKARCFVFTDIYERVFTYLKTFSDA